MKRLKDSLKERIALLRLQRGDSEAFGFIYETYVRQIYRYIYFRISDESAAHDLVQEVFLQTWQYIADRNKIDRIQSFLYKVAYRKVVDYYRARERQASLIEAIEDDGAHAIAPDHRELEVHFLRQHIKKLKQEYQDVIVLRHIESLSIREIADIVGKEPNNVRVSLHRAMESLRKEMDSQETHS
ncbi:MAG: RNA polymerase sigma factor [Patescibacteria group bacterium]